MISIIAQLAGIFLGALGVFSGAVHLVKVYTGCSTDEAVAKIQNLMNGKIVVPLANDPGFFNEICQAIRNIIGDKRYGELVKLNSALCAAGHTPVIACGTVLGLRCVDITIRPKDDTEKQILEAVLVDITKNHLAAQGLGPEVIADWKNRMDINSPYLEIRYPDNAQERKVILDTIAKDGLAAIEADTSLTDDEDF